MKNRSSPKTKEVTRHDSIQFVDSKPKASTDDVTIRRGRVSSVDLYEIKESELDLLESGGDEMLEFNFSIFLYSMAATSIASLSTADFSKRPVVQNVFLFASIIGVLLGTYLIISWARKHKSRKNIISRIRGRIPQKEDNVEEFASNDDCVENAPGVSKK